MENIEGGVVNLEIEMGEFEERRGEGLNRSL